MMNTKQNDFVCPECGREGQLNHHMHCPYPEEGPVMRAKAEREREALALANNEDPRIEHRMDMAEEQEEQKAQASYADLLLKLEHSAGATYGVLGWGYQPFLVEREMAILRHALRRLLRS